jgi:hypothetical protein
VPNFPVRRRGLGRRSTPAIAGLLLMAVAGCQTARAPNTYPVAVGQQPAYGNWATPPQGAAYPPTAAPMPGPAPQAWPQPPAPTTTMLPPAAQQPAYNGPSSQSLTGQWQQMQNNAANQWQQMPTQAQQQAQQAYANAQQQANQIPNQINQQANQYMNQANQQMNQAYQAGQQQVQQGLNQANQQMNQAFQAGQQQVAQYPPQQPTNPSFNPFATPAGSLPPARATPVAVPRY